MTFQRIALAVGLTAFVSLAAAQPVARQAYIVQLADPPAAAYRGTVPGLPATQPPAGRKLDIKASHVQQYLQYLDNKRNNAIAQVSPSAVMHRYSVAFNGFSAVLTPAEAQKLKSAPGVVAVTPDEPRQMDTTRTPAFLGLSTPGGLWSVLDASSRNVKGEDVIIGIVDGGIWPENASFSDKVDPATLRPVPYYQAGTQVYGPAPAKWAGNCTAGQGFNPATMCNNKLIGAQFFNAGFLAFGKPLWPTDYIGPRDMDGHGTHTASTAGGNENADALINGIPAGRMSGVAPRARIAAYRVCWTYVDAPGVSKNSCFTSDSVAAIDKAVADGVDVINYSISGTRTNYLDAVEVAFFNAVGAGVFVATSAGNSGPANTVAHMSPWLTTVAASTHDRFTVANVVLNDTAGSTFSGPSYQSLGVPPTDLILAQNAGTVPFASLSATDQAALSRCYNPADRATAGASALAALDPAKVAGKMVVCIRGGNVLVNKADSVKLAGGSAMIIQNTPSTANTTILQPYVVPAVHLPASASATVLAYAATAGAKASFTPATQVAGVVAPVMGDFSSRGPSLADNNILKPDISAPGVDVIAAYVADNVADQAVHDAIVAGATPTGAATSLQGTSMASPHVAGAGALLRQLHPSWSPAAIKSALMTTATGIKLANGALDPDRFGYGAGHLNPTVGADPGLVYDAGAVEYVQFLCGVGSLPPSHSLCQNFGSVAPWNLNLASLTAGDVLGKITINRTVTNVSNAASTYTANATIPGWSVTITPSTLTLAPGASASYSVNLVRTSAAVNTWTFGDIVWSDGPHQVKSPVTLKASLFKGPAEVTDTRAAGGKAFTVLTGYNGTLNVGATGLVAATRTSGAVATNAKQCFNFNVPAGALAARFALFNSDTQGGDGSDLDLEVYKGADGTGTLVGSSGSATSDELVHLAAPAAGTYSACVLGFAPAGGNATYTLSSWVVGPAVGQQSLRAGKVSQVTLGGTATVATSWNVAKGSRYLGVLRYTDGAGTALGSTVVSVDAR
ncbi:S8 family serine peptidase [Piscinibacter sp. XHJ-5]|uniref:S8 family serine peptidase n=1 Tax=Piscinibacter sp. XHJ-5 TaxID=3037797 RepID=UPI0024532DEC|nr:S8 family serine peptidase [Piscinibacter sp. XHJ-5]